MTTLATVLWISIRIMEIHASELLSGRIDPGYVLGSDRSSWLRDITAINGLMSTQIARALQLHQEARLAEEQGNIDRAKVLRREHGNLPAKRRCISDRYRPYYEEAEQILFYALNPTSTIFGESDERTVSIREQLRTLKP